MSSMIDATKTWNTFLDQRRPGDIYVDENGQTCEVLAVIGPDLPEATLRKLRHAAFRVASDEQCS